MRTNVAGDWITDFVRYHVLIRVFDGDTNAWLEVLQEKGMPARETIFVQWLRDRLRYDPDLLPRLRALVDESGIWPPDELECRPRAGITGNRCLNCGGAIRSTE